MRKDSGGIVLMRSVYLDRKSMKRNRIEYDNPFAHKLWRYLQEKSQKYNIDRFIEPKLGEAEIKFYKDGEILPDIKNNIRGRTVYLVHQFLGENGQRDRNAGSFALGECIDAIGRAAAEKLCLILPYEPYHRQDRIIPGTRQPVTARLYADFVQGACTKDLELSLITMDMHAKQIQGFYKIPFENLEALPLFLKHYKEKKPDAVVSPDTGGVERARFMAKYMGVPVVIIDKRRVEGQPVVMNIIGDVKGMNVVMVDDIIDSGDTIRKGARALKEKGANKIYVSGTHGILSGDYVDEETDKLTCAEENLSIPEIEEIVITDSVPRTPEYFSANPKFKELTASELFAEVISVIESDGSVKELFKYDY